MIQRTNCFGVCSRVNDKEVIKIDRPAHLLTHYPRSASFCELIDIQLLAKFIHHRRQSSNPIFFCYSLLLHSLPAEFAVLKSSARSPRTEFGFFCFSELGDFNLPVCVANDVRV
eukprot:2076610-Pleurochrysis_carterae.AAC.1